MGEGVWSNCRWKGSPAQHPRDSRLIFTTSEFRNIVEHLAKVTRLSSDNIRFDRTTGRERGATPVARGHHTHSDASALSSTMSGSEFKETIPRGPV